jgi:V8-like Glu-specific endopeptidase
MLVTAAHCIRGTGSGMVFAPGYQDGSAPYGTWNVTAAYGAAGWVSGQDPDDDFAFLQVRPSGGGTTPTVQSVVGSHPLASEPPAGSPVALRGYVAVSDTVMNCATTLGYTAEFPTVGCVGFADGTSGSPWLWAEHAGGAAVFGVTGGRNQGGCEADISYAAPLPAEASQILQQADAGVASEQFPPAGSSGC